MRRPAIFFLAFALLLSTLSSAQTGNDLAALRAKAEAGDVKSEVELGRAYRDGTGVPQNDVAALDWFMKAAKAGDPEGEDAVALNYRLEKNFSESLKWYGLAAKQGDANAMFNFGTHYFNGDGVPIDDVQAYAWFWLARRAGSRPAEEAAARAEKQLSSSQVLDGKLAAAKILARGEQVPRDAAAALAIFDAIANSGAAEFHMAIAKALIASSGLPQEGPRAEAQCRAALKDMRNKAPAMLCLGFLNQSGLLGPNHGKEAVEWYEKAFAIGEPVAAYGLGIAYATGNGVARDPAKAFRYLVVASIAKIPAATVLAEQLQAKLPQDVAKKQIKEARRYVVHNYSMIDQDQFSYAVKVDHLP